MHTIPATQLERFAVTILRAAGADEGEAQTVGKHLINSNLAGHDSHGVMRVLQYVQEIEAGQIQPGSELQILDEWASGAVLDANGLFGQVACHRAMQLAIEKSADGALAAVTIRRSNHSGRLGAYVAMAAESDRIGIVMANGGGAGQWVAPFGGRERRLSTNPLAIGSPSGGPFPFLLDISTSVAPEGKVRDRLQRGVPVPDEWLLDHEGRPTNDPNTLYADPAGALRPFGGTAGHKGFGLAFMVDLFAGALSAAGCPIAKPNNAAVGSGLCMLAIDIQRFVPLPEFLRRVREMAEYIKSSQPAAGFDEVLVPGEVEYQQRKAKEREGIVVPDDVWRQLNDLAERLRVPPKEEH